MKGKQLAILLGLVVVIGGTGLLLQRSNQQSWNASSAGTGPAGSKVLDLPLNDVAKVTIKSTGGELNLVRKNDVWTVQERASYPASFEQVSDLLRKFWDLKTVQEVKVGASQFARLDLEEPGKGAGAGTRIEFQNQDGKSLAAILLGKKFMKKGDPSFGDMGDMPAGRYLLLLGSTPKVSLVSDSLGEVEPKPEQWLLHDFFKVENPKSVTLAGTTDAQHWKITRENTTATWKLDAAKPDENFDSGKAGNVASTLANPSFMDVLPPDAKPADTGLDQPTILTAETFDGFTYTFKIGKLTGETRAFTIEVTGTFAKERTPAADEKPEDKTKLDEEFKTKSKHFEDKLAAEKKLEGHIYQVSTPITNELLKDRSALFVEKTPDPAPSPGGPGTGPTSVTTPPITVPGLQQ